MEKNEEIVRNMYEAVSKGNLNELDQWVDQNMTEHTPDPTMQVEGKGLEYVKNFFTQIRNAFPDFKMTVNEVFTKGDKVGVYYSTKGTQKGEMNGIPPTNKSTEVTGFDLLLLKDGKVTEHWGLYDSMKMMMDLELITEKELHGHNH
ncbi:MAG: ester cyclase [Bacteroidetes bacterium]|nr:ester cyclase [Bacteroidota bacterium]